MFKHILVPTDLTERSMQALDIAIKMASYSNSTITLLHVIETIEDTTSDQFTDFYAKLEKRAHKRMDQMVGLYESGNRLIDKEIVFGKRVAEIIRYAHDHHIDLIVLSSHRIDRENMMQGWGTISYKVGILSQCPVMLVK